MTNPTFSAITDFYSVTQLQRALYEAQRIAFGLLECRVEGTNPTVELMEAHRRLSEAGSAAGIEYAVCMKRIAPGKVGCGAPD